MLNKELLLTSATSKPQLVVNVPMDLSSPSEVRSLEYWSLAEKPYEITVGTMQSAGTYQFTIPSTEHNPPYYTYFVIMFGFATAALDMVNMEAWEIPPGSFRTGIRVINQTKNASVTLQTTSGGGSN